VGSHADLSWPDGVWLVRPMHSLIRETDMSIEAGPVQAVVGPASSSNANLTARRGSSGNSPMAQEDAGERMRRIEVLLSCRKPAITVKYAVLVDG
jgi:hypothetical protein